MHHFRAGIVFMRPGPDAQFCRPLFHCFIDRDRRRHFIQPRFFGNRCFTAAALLCMRIFVFARSFQHSQRVRAKRLRRRGPVADRLRPSFQRLGGHTLPAMVFIFSLSSKQFNQGIPQRDHYGPFFDTRHSDKFPIKSGHEKWGRHLSASSRLKKNS